MRGLCKSPFVFIALFVCVIVVLFVGLTRNSGQPTQYANVEEERRQYSKYINTGKLPYGGLNVSDGPEYLKLEKGVSIFDKFPSEGFSDKYLKMFTMQQVKDNLKAARVTDEDLAKESRDIQDYLNNIRVADPLRLLSYTPATTGIVMSYYGKQNILGIVNMLYTLHAFKTTFPVEIWVENSREISFLKQYVDKIYPEGYATIKSLDSVRSKITKLVGKVNRVRRWDPFHHKLHAIIGSSFQRVLFVDLDAFLLQEPVYIVGMLAEDNNPIALWSDCYGLEKENPVFNMLGLKKLPGTGKESGVLYIDKKFAWKTLLVSCRMNHLQNIYYSMLYGDKDIYGLASQLTGEIANMGFLVPGRMGIKGDGKNFTGGPLLQPLWNGEAAYLHLTAHKQWFLESAEKGENILQKALIYDGTVSHIEGIGYRQFAIKPDDKTNENYALVVSGTDAVGNFDQVFKFYYNMAKEMFPDLFKQNKK